MIVMLTCMYTEILGGAEKQCATLTGALRGLGEDVLVISSKVPSITYPPLEPNVKRFWTYQPPNLAGKHLPASLLWALQVFLWVCFNRKRIRVLHCHQLRIHAYVAALASWLLGIPTVMKPGIGGPLNDFVVIGRHKYIVGKRGAKFVARHTGALIAISSQIESDALTWGIPKERIHRIPNGVDMSLAKAIEIGANDPRFTAFDNNIQMAFVGRLSHEKNIIPIVEAFLSLKTDKAVTLNLIGDGPLRQAVIDRIKNAPPNIRIILHGETNDVFALLKQMHFLVLVSSSEGLSNALLEGCCAGLVPILSDASGNRDVITFPDYPFFIGNESCSSIAQTMNAATTLDKAQWLGWSTKIADHARKTYDINEVADRYRKLYKVNRNKGRK